MRIITPKRSSKSCGQTDGLASSTPVEASSQLEYEQVEFADAETDISQAIKTGGAEVAARIKPASSYQDVYNRGVFLLSMREHSRQELSNKLSRKFKDQTHIQTAVEQLAEDGYLCDDRFTESYVRMRRGRGFGPVRIRSELQAKGVDTSLIDNYVQAYADDWSALAEDVYCRKYGDTLVADYQEWSKRARFMHSRGFEMDHIHEVVPREKN